MTVQILLITHNNIGAELMLTAKQMLHCCAIAQIQAMGISPNASADNLKLELTERLHQFSADDHILILTDMFGATPSNIACTVAEKDNIHVVSGLNLPMLIRVLNYPDLNLDELKNKAISGGQEGVLHYEALETRD